MIIGIVAAGKNWEIGKKNGLLFDLPLDLKYFKEKTLNHFVVMGYNTLLSLPNGKPLKDRKTIVLCPEGIEPEDCIVFHNFEFMVEVLKQLKADVYVCGGGMLYNSMLPYYDKCLITKVNAEDKEATVFFPNLDENKDFKITEQTETLIDNNYEIKFVTYERTK